MWPLVISFILVGGYAIFLLSGPKGPDHKDRLFKLLHDNEFFVRQPQNRWQRFFSLYWRDHAWARRLLGGIWEGYVHDMGTRSAIVTWHWVEKRSAIKSHPLFRVEEYDQYKPEAVEIP